ncbi:hypothetical protein LTR37_015719 [Vermiconidia calcicola]|uniref:Uncharacterized protein n=1 Tax=Vermiconidia calcicola TaxID=1690605 RepID=A0ACC3MQM3_9PEZI|nr:hypothetical protein LTR37_015719 [Vermiconidia calcicola]
MAGKDFSNGSISLCKKRGDTAVMRPRPPQTPKRKLGKQPIVIIDDDEEALDPTTPAAAHTLLTSTFAPLATSSFEGVDLNTRFAAETPKITFATKASRYVAPIVLLTTSNPALACMEIKKWLVAKCCNWKMFAPGAIRMEGQKLHGAKMRSVEDGGKGAWILLAEDAAHIHRSANNKISYPISILAVIVPGDPDVRWFYTVLPISSLLKHLDHENLLDPSVRQWQSSESKHHKRLYTFLTTAFTAATTFPDSEDWRNAEQITDCCPPILDPETALVRLECNPYLYFARKDGFEIGNDRYLTLLEPAEREVAGMVGLKCAEYLLIKRSFFRCFFEEIYRSEKSAEVSSRGGEGGTRNGNAGGGEGDGVAQQQTIRTPFRRETTPTIPFGTPTTVCESNATPLLRTPAAAMPTSSLPAGPRRGGARTGWRNRVRTEHAHQVWLENEYEFRSTRAKMLVVAWRELGFLDEGRFLGWVREGGMFEGEGNEGMCERVDGDGEEGSV